MPQTRLSRTHRNGTGLARSTTLALIALCCSLVLLADPGGAQPWAAGVAQGGEARDIAIHNYSFSPRTLTVPEGATVTWTNRDFDVHTVVADDTPPTFKSAGLDTDDSFSFTFTSTGDYKYFCSLHPHMTGMIKVE